MDSMLVIISIIATASLLACYCVAAIDDCEQRNSTSTDMPDNWPCQWDRGVIPYVFDYYSTNLKRLITMVHNGLHYIESKACITFIDHSPVELAQLVNYTYLYFSYSSVLEECCGRYFYKTLGRRVVLITPVCRNRAEIAHATLHALGATHKHGYPFSSAVVNAALFPKTCLNKDLKFLVNTREETSADHLDV